MTSLAWYHKTTIYQIYPRSFNDSNGDGIGDLQGIRHRLEYIQGLGFETIWVSPFFASPQADFGYDISDYTSIAPEYGTMEDFSGLVEETHRRGMKIVLDMVMNHTSNEHAWFRESRSSRVNSKADWYIWRDRPNNWQSMTGGSGWHYAEERRQYYWASFLPFQPDLNYRNPEVKNAMFDIVRFWLGRGVDGFRLDLFNIIYKDAEFRNNPLSLKLIPTEEEPSSFFQTAKYTLNQPESFAFAREFRSVCEEFGGKLSIGEVSGGTKIIRHFLGEEINDGLTLVFDFGMMNFKFTANYFHDLIRNMERQYPHPFMPVYVFSNHDKHRSMHRLGNDVRKARLLHFLQLTVRGVPCMYYGEEIGMTNVRLPLGTALDPVPHKFKYLPRFVFDLLGITINRDEVRTPMQWNGGRNAGFSAADRTWLPLHEDYRAVNVDVQSRDGRSLLHTVRSLLDIRGRERALQQGSLELMENLPDEVLGYVRSDGSERLYILLNFGNRDKEFDVPGIDCLADLITGMRLDGSRVRLNGFGGRILKPLC